MLHSKYLPGRFARQSYGAPLNFAPATSSPPGPSWSVDATSGIAVPASAAEWTAFIASKGLSVSVPDALWLMQEASGNAADSIGSFTLTAGGTGLAYQQAVSGWSRKAITFTDGGTGQLKSTSASLPDISTTSQLTLVIALVSTIGGTRNFVTQGTTKSALNLTNAAPRVRVASSSNSTDGALDPTVGVKPFVLGTNRTAGSTTGYTDVEKLSPTFSTAVTGKTACIGANSANGPGAAVLYACEWHAAKAELTDANVKALLQALGFTVTGY